MTTKQWRPRKGSNRVRILDSRVSARGRKRAEDAVVRFLGNGKVVLSVPGKPPLVSRRGDSTGSSIWLVLHALGLTAYDGDDFLISVQRTTT